MSKRLCKLVSDDLLKDHMKDYVKLVNKPKYICKKCGRVANDEDSLCKPMKLKKDESSEEKIKEKSKDKLKEKSKDKKKDKKKSDQTNENEENMGAIKAETTLEIENGRD